MKDEQLLVFTPEAKCGYAIPIKWSIMLMPQTKRLKKDMGLILLSHYEHTNIEWTLNERSHCRRESGQLRRRRNSACRFFYPSVQYTHYVQIRLNINVWLRVCAVKQKKQFKFHSTFVWVMCEQRLAGCECVWITAKLTVVCGQLEQKNSNLELQHIPAACLVS